MFKFFLIELVELILLFEIIPFQLELKENYKKTRPVNDLTNHWKYCAHFIKQHTENFHNSKKNKSHAYKFTVFIYWCCVCFRMAKHCNQQNDAHKYIYECVRKKGEMRKQSLETDYYYIYWCTLYTQQHTIIIQTSSESSVLSFGE